MKAATAMTFDFRSQMRAHAGPVQKPALGFRAITLHASEITEAAERFIREQLTRKRERTLDLIATRDLSP